jgi:uncharacterized alpha-E superfamily protein
MEPRSRSELGDIEDDLDELIISLVALSGFAQESMLRGEAWLFLDIGRRLERGQQLCRLLRAAMVNVLQEGLESALLDAVLAGTESSMAYRRGYHDSPSCEPALILLLFDESNPRSLAFQLQTLQGHMELLPGDEDRRQPSGQAHRLSDALAGLRAVEPSVLVEGDAAGQRAALNSLLDACDRLLRETANGLKRDYFTDVGDAQQLISSG